MPYEPSLDKNLFSKAYQTEGSRLTVSVFSYNNGPKKLQISRETAGADNEFKFAKLGRMTKEEATAVLPFIQEALQNM